MKGRGSHKAWTKAGKRTLGFPVSNPGQEVRTVYLKRIRNHLGIKEADHG
ncbi:hypothetical protein IIA16_06655 [bacterium]|nr:hypothetical protein [bacterium]